MGTENTNNAKECMKFMTVEMHPQMLENWYCADISREVSAAKAKLVPTSDLYDPGLVMWSRVLPPTLANQNGELALLNKNSCKQALYIMTAEEVSEFVANHGLTKHIIGITNIVSCTLSLVVFGVREYFKPAGKRRTMNSSRKKMTEQEFEMAKIDLLIGADCDTTSVNTPNELALHIVQYTKAIAEAPAKLAKRELDEKAEFYMRGEKRKPVTIDQGGQGVEQAWQQMVGVLPGSSLELSRAICRKYQTLSDILQACQHTDGVETINEIAEIGVSRSAVPGSVQRRIGPEFARKLHILFSADDGDTVIE